MAFTDSLCFFCLRLTILISLSWLVYSQKCCSDTYYNTTTLNTCSDASNPTTQDSGNCAQCLAYQCIDWTMGSKRMGIQQELFKSRTGEDVLFGVGSFGSNNARAGLCYRVNKYQVQKDIIIQVIDKSNILLENSIYAIVADGGFSGSPDACANGIRPMYSSTTAAWGQTFGGAQSKSACLGLPKFPTCAMNAPEDNLQALCTWSYNMNILGPTANGVTGVTSSCQVPCPQELVSVTGLQRADENTSLPLQCGGKLLPDLQLFGTMINCGKPAYASPQNIQYNTVPGYSVVMPCRRDGYTRINQIPSPSPTLKPSSHQPLSAVRSATPTARATSMEPTETAAPTAESTYSPTASPTEFPTYTSAPSRKPTNSPTTYFNYSLANHSMKPILLSVDLFIRSVRYLSASDLSLDVQSLKAICNAVDTTLEVPLGSTTVTSYAALLSSDFDITAMVEEREESLASVDHFRDIQVELQILVRFLTAKFRSSKLIDRDWLITYLGSVLISSANDGELTSTLQDIAMSVGARTMLVANVTDAKVEYREVFSPPTSEEDSKEEHLNSNARPTITLTEICMIVLATTVGLLLGYAISIRVCQDRRKKDEQVPTNPHLCRTTTFSSDRYEDCESPMKNNNNNKFSYKSSSSRSNCNELLLSHQASLMISRSTSLDSVPEYFEMNSMAESLSSSSTSCMYPNYNNSYYSKNENMIQYNNHELFVTVDTSAQPHRSPQFTRREKLVVNCSAPSPSKDGSNDAAGEALA